MKVYKGFEECFKEVAPRSEHDLGCMAELMWSAPQAEIDDLKRQLKLEHEAHMETMDAYLKRVKEIDSLKAEIEEVKDKDL